MKKFAVVVAVLVLAILLVPEGVSAQARNACPTCKPGPSHTVKVKAGDTFRTPQNYADAPYATFRVKARGEYLDPNWLQVGNQFCRATYSSSIASYTVNICGAHWVLRTQELKNKNAARRLLLFYRPWYPG